MRLYVALLVVQVLVLVLQTINLRRSLRLQDRIEAVQSAIDKYEGGPGWRQ